MLTKLTSSPITYRDLVSSCWVVWVHIWSGFLGVWPGHCAAEHPSTQSVPAAVAGLDRSHEQWSSPNPAINKIVFTYLQHWLLHDCMELCGKWHLYTVYIVCDSSRLNQTKYAQHQVISCITKISGSPYALSMPITGNVYGKFHQSVVSKEL